jgi:hypothetical protein
VVPVDDKPVSYEQCAWHDADMFRHVGEVLHAFTNKDLYSSWIVLPTANSPPAREIQARPTLRAFFGGALGAIDGTHIPVTVPFEDHGCYRDRKGNLSMNVLAACTFDLRFSYLLVGYEGSANDQTVFNHALNLDLTIPIGRYFLADAGFGLHTGLLTPYQSTRYHLREYSSGTAV